MNSFTPCFSTKKILKKWKKKKKEEKIEEKVRISLVWMTRENEKERKR